MTRRDLRAIGWGMVGLLAGLAAVSPPSQGGEITGIVSFGDSLTDVGNFYGATNGASPPQALGYARGEFTNGWNWVQYLARDLGVPAPTASTAGGTDYAYGGAMTGTGTTLGGFNDASGNTVTATVPNVEQQISNFLNSNTPAAGQLFTVWGGANDLLHTPNPTLATALGAADNIAAGLSALASKGAGQIIVANLPLLGEVPAIKLDPTIPTAAKQGLDGLSLAFNQELQADLARLGAQFTGTQFHLLDINAIVNDTLANPAAYGFTNTTQGALQDGVFSGQGYLYWDGLHPTTQADQLIASVAAEAVPEPSSLALYAAAMAATVAWARARRLAAID